MSDTVENSIPFSEISWLDHAFYPCITRLSRITGFATTLHPPSDPRPLAFSRFHHVRRVVRIAVWLAETQNRHGDSIDVERTAWFGWAHDLNRLPFAHNAEQGVFDPAGDISGFLGRHNIPVPNACGDELKAIISRDAYSLSPEGRIALLSDIVTGFFEDALFAVTGIDLIPELMPEDMANRLHLPYRDPTYRKKLLEMNLLLHEKRDVETYLKRFNDCLQTDIERYLHGFGTAQYDKLLDQQFWELRDAVKKKFMKERLFPYNNENVSHGSLLRQRIILPLIGILKDEWANILTNLDEVAVMELAKQHQLVNVHDPWYYPDLDYVMKHVQQLSFRLNEKTQNKKTGQVQY